MDDHDKKNNKSDSAPKDPTTTVTTGEKGEHDKKNNNESDPAPNDPTTTDTTGEKDEKDPNAGKPNEVTDPPKKNPKDSTGAGYNLAEKLRDGIEAMNGFYANIASGSYHLAKITVNTSRHSVNLAKRAAGSLLKMDHVKKTEENKNVADAAPKPLPGSGGGPNQDEENKKASRGLGR
jgi:hypothetical protein